jgi:hypothetical protein
MSRLASLLICVCLLSGVRVAAAPAEPAGEAAPPLTAAFETVTKGHAARQRWTLARDADRVAYTFGEAAERRFDLWLRRAAELRLVRVFPGEKTAVEYTEGQLRALGTARSWQQLGSLLPAHPAKLGLKLVSSGTFQQRKTQRFEGQLNGERVVVQWLEAEQLAAQITLKNRTITLQKLVLGRPALAPEADTKRYRRIDAADLGDLEHDPFVKRYGSLLNAAHQHP